MISGRGPLLSDPTHGASGFSFANGKLFDECLRRGLAVAPPPQVWSLVVIVLEEGIPIGLRLLTAQAFIDDLGSRLAIRPQISADTFNAKFGLPTGPSGTTRTMSRLTVT